MHFNSEHCASADPPDGHFAGDRQRGGVDDRRVSAGFDAAKRGRGRLAEVAKAFEPRSGQSF